jgi:hypothetical protein
MAFWRIREALRPFIFAVAIFCFRFSGHNDYFLRWLRFGWGNCGWSADDGYLRVVKEIAQRSRGPILECGSGLTTIILGLVAPGQTTSLEHTGEWKDRVIEIANRYSVPVNIQSAPLVPYGDFDWYKMPSNIDTKFSVVICDGPPSATRGGRYGLLPVAKSYLSAESVILMDDAEREDEQKIIERWRSEFAVTSKEYASGTGSHAVVSFRQSEVPGHAAAQISD